MRLSFHLPMEACSTEREMDASTEALARFVDALAGMNVVLFGELPPVESWEHLELDDDQENLLPAPALFSRGSGNILSLAALRVADLRRKRHRAEVRVVRQTLPSGTIFVTCQVVRYDGSLDEWFERLRRLKGGPKLPPAPHGADHGKS